MDGSRARALLGVPEHATTQQISRAFRGAAFVAHPDQGGNGATFRELVSARDILLAAAPRAAVANPYSSSVAAPATPSFSIVDVTRRPPATTPEAGGRSVSFDDVLASVLTAA